MRLQTLQSYDGRDVPGNFNPTTQTVVGTSKFSVLSRDNLRSMSKDVLETILILDFKAQGRGRRFQYAACGPPPPDGGHTTGRFQRPSERVPFSDEGGFVFSEAPFKGTLHEGLKGASPSEGFKGASPSEGRA